MSSEAKSSKKLYYLVFLALFVLTILELWVPEWNTTTAIKGSVLTFLACIKAFLVAWVFMHLSHERKVLWYIAAIPISAAVYTVVVVLESVYR